MKPNLSYVKAIIFLIVMLFGLVAIIFSQADIMIRIIAATAGFTACIVLGIVYYVFQRGSRHGK